LRALPVLRWWELGVVATVALVSLWALIVFFDAVNRETTNGLAKSIDVARWVERSPERVTDAGNLLYYPVIGLLVQAMPESLFGAVWQRMAYLNALFGAGVLALTYAIAFRLFRDRNVALFACLAHFSTGFFLLLATINEDIMPGYFWFMAAVACAVVPGRLSPMMLCLSAQCLALSWLFHSSLQLPGIGAFIVGIAAFAGSRRQAVRPLLVFCAALVPLPVISAVSFGLPWSAGWWSGKGLGTGWGGFSANKIAFMGSGITQSVAGGHNIGVLDAIVTYPYSAMMGVTLVLMTALFGYWLFTGWGRQRQPEWRLAVGILCAVFVLGEGMNLYIQPQDPQMQIQPMTWFPFAAACAFAWAAGVRATAVSRALRCAALLLVAALIAGNLRGQMAQRHSDTIALQNIERLRALAPPERTVFLLQGFEGMITWLMMAWGTGAIDAPAFEIEGPGRLNAIYVASQATVYPDRSPETAAEEVVWLVDHAVTEGLDVVTSDLFTAPEESWVDGFSTISGPEKPRAIYAALQARYVATALGDVPGWARLYRLARKPGVSPLP